MSVVAAHRRAALGSLIPALEHMPKVAQSKWAVWRSHQAHKDSIPELFSDALNRIAAFIDPVIDEAAQGRSWDPTAALWRSSSLTLPTARELIASGASLPIVDLESLRNDIDEFLVSTP